LNFITKNFLTARSGSELSHHRLFPSGNQRSRPTDD